MGFSEEQIKSLAPTPAAFNAGKKLSPAAGWEEYGKSERAIWGAIRGSGKKPYLTEIDMQSLAYKCSCPSRQFPCKHAIGLMLLHGSDGKGFSTVDEPEWVKDWLDKRRERQEKQDAKPQEERTEEQIERSEKNKQKTQEKRLESVIAGAGELELWLKDLVRIGILELPNKPHSEFEKVAKRMVDAKAPGLAGWVRALGNLDFSNQNEWQDAALRIISKLYLLLRTIKNYSALDEPWQQTIKNLSGWSQSTKELVADPQAETIKDHWLVMGQQEETNDEVVTQRNWLIGCESNRQVLVLNFSTKFSTFETHLLPGSMIEAELAFFPSVQPFRAAIKLQRNVFSDLPKQPQPYTNWDQVHQERAKQLKINPWYNDQVCTVQDVRLWNNDNQWFLLDGDNKLMPLDHDYTHEKCLQWLSITGNRATTFSGVLKNERMYPFGIFDNGSYKLL